MIGFGIFFFPSHELDLTSFVFYTVIDQQLPSVITCFCI
uniref:Uncharacterized protein n=1 Tax=Rhizophora mucronata TaxID=61149 RepID=A0A2P2P6K4_RHIMU